MPSKPEVLDLISSTKFIDTYTHTSIYISSENLSTHNLGARAMLEKNQRTQNHSKNTLELASLEYESYRISHFVPADQLRTVLGQQVRQN